MLAYSSIGQIKYVIIGIIVGDANGGYIRMIIYMLLYIPMNLRTFAWIGSFGLCTDIIQKDNFFGSLFSLVSYS